MIKMLLIAAIATIGAVAPASAVTFNAFTAFNGTTNPAGAFSFGETDLTTLTPFVNFSDCAPGLRCLLGSEPAIGIYKNVTGSPLTAFSTVAVPADKLFFHPGPSLFAYVAFTAPTSGNYLVNFDLKLLSISTITGTQIALFSNNGSNVTFFPALMLTELNPSVMFGGITQLLAGESFGIAVGADGDFNFDSTQIGFTVTNSVPEPASWALLIAGFGLTGAAMRRRRTAAIAA